MRKLVSAVITTHNRLDLLKRAIDSVFAQTYSNIECIVVSDNSTDGTNEYCESRKDIVFINIKPEESKGGNYARNLGIKAAKGDYVAFLDDDDYWFPEKTAMQVKLLEDKQCGCVYCLRQYELVKEGIIIRRTKESDDGKIEGDISSLIFKHYVTSTSCLLVSKELLAKIGGFSEDLIKWQEYELMIKLSTYTEVYYCHDNCLVGYTINRGDKKRVSNQFYRVPIATKYVRRKYSKRIKELPLLVKFYFYDMIISEYYRSAKKTGIKRYQIPLFPVYYLMRFVKKCIK